MRASTLGVLLVTFFLTLAVSQILTALETVAFAIGLGSSLMLMVSDRE